MCSCVPHDCLQFRDADAPASVPRPKAKTMEDSQQLFHLYLSNIITLTYGMADVHHVSPTAYHPKVIAHLVVASRHATAHFQAARSLEALST